MKHHYLPRVYLKGFAHPHTDDGYIYRYEKQTGRSISLKVKNAAIENNLYSFTRHDGTKDHKVESFLAAVESDAAPYIQEMAAGSLPDERGRCAISRLLASFLMRSPRIRDHWRVESMRLSDPTVTIEEIERVQAKTLPKGVTNDDLEKLKVEVQESGIGLALPDRCFPAYLVDWIRKSAPFLERMNWVLEKAPKGDCFAASDNPVFARRRGHELDESVVGFCRDDLAVEVGVPVSEKYFLMLTWSDCWRYSVRVVTRSRVHFLNERTVISGYSYIFSPRSSLHLNAMIQRHSNFRVAYPMVD